MIRPSSVLPFSRRWPLAAVLALAAFPWLPGGLRAQQGSAAAALSQQADALFDRHQYKEAAAAYENLLKGYPNSEYAPDAQFHLAYTDFLLGQFDPAVDLLRRLQAQPGTAPDALEQAGLLLPQVLAQQAGALKADDPGRTAAYEAVIKEYDAFVGKFPRSTSLEAALYGRALASYQIARYDAAVRDLRQNVTSFPKSDTVLDSEFLLAITTATQANLTQAKDPRTTADTAAALKDYQEAEHELDYIIERHTDLSLANDAQFQLGETLLAHAAAAPAGERDAIFRRALAAYRAVEPKEPMIAAQQARVQGVADALLAERRKGAAADRARARQLDNVRLREQGKLEALQTKDDPVLTARIKSGGVFYSLRKYDETRVLMEALLPAAKKPEDEKLALNYLALSYAVQNLTDKAVAAYDRFQARFPADPVAENLTFTMAVMFQTGDKADPARAAKYLEEFSRRYPNSRLRETALLSAAANAAALGHYDEALRTVDTFLKDHPRRELMATGELDRAQFLHDKHDLDGALGAFKKVRDTYKGLPEAEEAAFWVGRVDFEKGDLAGAVNELNGYLSAFPAGKLRPSAMLTLAQAQVKGGGKDPALATLADLSGKYPDSPEAANAYFLRANIYLTDKKYDDVTRVLTEFTDKYPGSDQAFSAYNTLASIQTQANRNDEAAATYEKFIAKQPPGNPQVADALSREAALWLRAARGMGSFIVLTAPQREAWTAAVDRSVAASERQLQAFPDAPATALGLQNLLECQRLLVSVKAKTEEQVVQYFQGLADRYKDNPAARSRILFRLASLTAEKDPARALADMKAAYDPHVVYGPADLDLYSKELLASDPKAAAAVFDKAARDYPIPAGSTPAQAPLDVQDAQAMVLYGRGRLAEAKGDKAGAAARYQQLIKDYPRSSKVSEAKLGLAESLVANGKPDEAMPLLADVMKLPVTPLLARARAMFLVGGIQEGKGQEGAMDSYLKVAVFYPASPEAPEGLWKGGQLLEKQAVGLGETPAKPGGPTKPGQLARARQAYQDLVSKYPDSKYVAQAKARLAELPAPSPAK